MIEVHNLSSLLNDEPLREKMHRLRYDMFKERYNWDIPHINKLEIDQYDRQCVDPHYLIALDDQRNVIGTARLISTERPYMIKDIFPHIMAPKQPPQTHKIWEGNRIAVAQNAGDYYTSQGQCTGALLMACCEFAISHGVDEMIGTYTLAVCRLLKMLGTTPKWQTASYRLDDGKCRIVSIETNAQMHKSIAKACDLTGPVISHDFTLSSKTANEETNAA